MIKKLILFVLPFFLTKGKSQNHTSHDYGISISNKENFSMPDPNAVLDLSSVNNKGFLWPKVELKHPAHPYPMKLDPGKVTQKPNYYDGIIVYNMFESGKSNQGDFQLTRGHYVWNNGRWNPLRSVPVVRSMVSDGIDVAVLGYFPEGGMYSAPKYLDDYIAVESIGNSNHVVYNYYPYRATQVKCKAFTKSEYPLYGNNHSYCAYKIDFYTTRDSRYTGLNWIEAFNLAKRMGGYLPVITTTESRDGARDGEWYFIKKEFLSDDTINYYQQANIWIGYNKVQYPGTYERECVTCKFPEYTWITGEKSAVNWETTSDNGSGGLAKIQSYFALNEPNNDKGIEGCTHIWEYFKGFINGVGNVDTTTRTWNDSACNIRRTRAGIGPGGGNNFNYFLVEFQN